MPKNDVNSIKTFIRQINSAAVVESCDAISEHAPGCEMPGAYTEVERVPGKLGPCSAEGGGGLQAPVSGEF